MARLRYNGLSNSLGASLTSGGTTITFASKLTYAGGDVPTISGSDYIPLSILDADGNCSEVVHLTAYTSAATTGTIARGKEDTSGVAHDSGVVVVNGPTAGELDAIGKEYFAEGAGTSSYTTTSTTFVDVDASNLVVSVPAAAGDVLEFFAHGYVRDQGGSSGTAQQIALICQTSGTEMQQSVASDTLGKAFVASCFGRYTVAPGDISGGVVEIRMKYRQAPSGTAELFNGADRRPSMKVRNVSLIA